jgi:hypothetical protein
MIRRLAFPALAVLAALMAVLWGLSYRARLDFSCDSHALQRRFEVIEQDGILFFNWMELRQAPGGQWEPGAQAALESLGLGFGAFAMPGP